MLQIDRRFIGRAVELVVAGAPSRADAARGPGQAETSSGGVSFDGNWTVATDSRFGRRQPQRGGVERLSSSLVLTLAASLMAIACVVTLA